MARFDHNIYSKARGSIGGITYSLARDRQGKLQTGRERVAPANPNTPQQQAIRNNLSDSVIIYQGIELASAVPAFDRSVEKLPAYQSILSLFTRHKAYNTVTDRIQVTGPPLAIMRGMNLDFRLTNLIRLDSAEYQVSVVGVVGELPPNPTLTYIAIPADGFASNEWWLRVQTESTPWTGEGSYFIVLDELIGMNTDGILFAIFIHEAGIFNPASLSTIRWGYFPA